MKEGLIYTNNNCIGCNKCVRICYSFGASISDNRPEGATITIDPERCLNCGGCIDACTHQARDYRDDTEQFFKDLENGEKITVMVAPSFEAKYPEKYKNILATLKKRGVNRIFSISYGADICTWAYLKLILNAGYFGKISTTCPVIVSYIEHWMPELIPQLMPVKSPLMCAAVYCRNELKVGGKYAFIGPCIAKHHEVEKYSQLVQYNVTFPKLLEHLGDDICEEEEPFEELNAGLGTFYPAPGGLAYNVQWFLGDNAPVRSVSGKSYMYRHILKNKNDLRDNKLPYVLFDALNCHDGCIEGTAKDYHGDSENRENMGFTEIREIRLKSRSDSPESPWNPNLSFDERLENLYAQFSHLDVSDYMTEFRDKSASCKILTPSEKDTEEIFKSMHKFDEQSRHIDCSSCGYDSCYEMMTAIFNGFNNRHNCVHSEKEESLYLNRMSFTDRLTGVMNRNAYEENLRNMFTKAMNLGLVVVDINGLKQTNDTEGHAAGDRLITESAKALSNVFGVERVFRIGGDEFLVVLQDFEEDEIQRDLKKAKEYLASINVYIATGVAFVENFDGDMSELIEIADNRMYDDKKRYYEQTGKERRR